MAEPLRDGRESAGVTPRVIFAGTPAFAAHILQRIAKAGWEIPLVITQPPAPRGRGRAVQPSRVAAVATQLGLTVSAPARINQTTDAIKNATADVMLVAAYGQLIPEAVFTVPRLGTLNVHASLLPRYRGATPIPAAILAGETETGVSLMQIETGLDTGPVFAAESVTIESTDTTGSLTERLAATGAELVLSHVPKILAGTLTATVQDETVATLTKPLTKAAGQVDWRQPAEQIERHIRAMQPWPGAWTTSDGQRLELIVVAPVSDYKDEPGAVSRDGIVGTAPGGLRLMRVKPAGRTEMAAADWLRGRRETPRFT